MYCFDSYCWCNSLHNFDVLPIPSIFSNLTVYLHKFKEYKKRNKHKKYKYYGRNIRNSSRTLMISLFPLQEYTLQYYEYIDRHF